MRRAIEDGTYAVGQRLPSGRELARTYAVAPMTMQQALRELRDQGLIVTWQGRGMFVRGATGNGDEQPAPTMAGLMSRLDAIHDELQRLEDRVAALETRSPAPRRSRQAADR